MTRNLENIDNRTDDTRKLLLVTFPVDLGNLTLERLLIKLFEGRLDLVVHRFAPEQSSKFYLNGVDYKANRRDRFAGSLALWQQVYSASKEGRSVLFHAISPALFSYPLLHRTKAYIITDWTRKLYEPIVNKELSPTWLTLIHKHVLNSVLRIFAMTDAVIESLTLDYGVKRCKIEKVNFPIDLNLFHPRRTDNNHCLKLLFVGGDLKRKGGDVLLEWFNARRPPNVQLTVVSNSQIGNHDGVRVERGVEYGQERHIDIFQEHDVLVLPTLCDGYPFVLAEAAASGLAIVTTKFALGAPSIVNNGFNGFICNSQEEVFSAVERLIANPGLVKKMKINSRIWMEDKFSNERIFDQICSRIFND